MWRVLAVFVAIGALGAALWLDRRPLLESAADHWVVSDQIAPADAVAVLGGGIEDRPFAAAEYYRQGLVKKVLLSNAHKGPAENIGAMPSQVEATRDVLLKLGVPNSAIETFGSDLSNTHEEALALRAWAEHTAARSVIVPTEIFSARRVRWMLDRVFGDDVVIRVPALDPPIYRCDDWWQHEEGVVSFQNEIIKYVYYRIRY
jgi:uncharacterized SAM-binding protein YcdF (DUF218 family)